MTVDAEAALDMSLDDVIVAASRSPKGKGKSKGKAIEKASAEKTTEPDASEALLDLSLEEVIAASSKGISGRKGGKGQGYESGKASDKGKGRPGGSWKGGKDWWEGGSSKGDWEDWKGGKAEKWGPSKDHKEGWVSKKADGWGSAKQADSWKDWKSDKSEKWGGGTSKQDGWEDWKPTKAGGEVRGSGTWARDRDGGKDSWGKPPMHDDGWAAQDSKPDNWGKSARDRERDRDHDRERKDEWVGRPASGHAGAGGAAGKWWGRERDDAFRASGRDRYTDRYDAQTPRSETSHDRYASRGGGTSRGPAGDGWPSGGQKRPRREEDDNDRDRRSKLIKVTNIPLDLDWKDIKEAFEAETGKIERCDLRGGTALIKFARVEDAYRAAETFDRGELNGKIISVTVEH